MHSIREWGMYRISEWGMYRISEWGMYNLSKPVLSMRDVNRNVARSLMDFLGFMVGSLLAKESWR